jgi:hypothetical protein
MHVCVCVCVCAATKLVALEYTAPLTRSLLARTCVCVCVCVLRSPLVVTALRHSYDPVKLLSHPSCNNRLQRPLKQIPGSNSCAPASALWTHVDTPNNSTPFVVLSCVLPP